MRITHVTSTFPPYRGGTGNVVYHQARELARLGHDVRVVTAGARVAASDDPPGVRVHRLPALFGAGNAAALRGMGACLDASHVVHLHYPCYGAGEQVAWQCRRRRIPYVVTYHQDALFPFPASLAAHLHHALAGAWILRGARLVAATTPDYAAHSRLRALPPGRVVELPNGVDVERFRPDVDASAQRVRHGLHLSRAVVLFVGGLDRPHYFKGVPVLLRALAALPDADLVVAGEGDLRPAYERQAASLGVRRRVHFAGRVADEELPRYYALADVAALPSTTRGEAFGLVLLEAMASGKPVVASRLPGVRTVVEDGATGLLAMPGDAADLAAKLAALLGDGELRARMGAAGRRVAERRYDWRHIAPRLLEVYARALSGSPERPREPVPAGGVPGR